MNRAWFEDWDGSSTLIDIPFDFAAFIFAS